MRMRHLLYCLVPAALSSPACALATGTAPAVPWLRLVTSFAFCVLLAWAAIILLRKHKEQKLPIFPAFLSVGIRSTTHRRITILETRRASQHGELCLAEIDKHLYVLALTSSGATLLDKWTASDETTLIPGDLP